MARQIVELVVFSVDENGRAPDTPTWMAMLRTNVPIGCFSLEEMVKKITILCGSGNREIRRLTIIGHGDRFHQSIGVHEIRPDIKNLKFGGQETQLFKEIRKYFSKDGEIVLGGCEVGKTDKIVNALSLILSGIKVKAFSACQRPALMGYLESQGGMVESINGHTISRTPTNVWDAGDKILFRIFGAPEE